MQKLFSLSLFFDELLGSVLNDVLQVALILLHHGDHVVENIRLPVKRSKHQQHVIVELVTSAS